ncbi:Putative bifunctional glutamate synthase subunit beta/2-polyprenylphenol hydroxylase domain protein [Candidatus Trichorickettsia mobilis]|uniref:Bifunctional glutamate synthase subunit beta/2-polyprenylphenol hydroxylase domain protein n=1 Tax=Candidatus Trichorickettsia mobilis TaxID=1346319 RepID=A0ABZ0UWF0_9RICK|nr:FAD-dependent oxidoreductase [Candidatus Trichorickettsia mobilis]WPY00389.1 Putative bifunctional glutamate synthase subunit beta/2-polyprenylphenol hydroxylase domain protein [Candidatus Trichorickettsia mobilis]
MQLAFGFIFDDLSSLVKLYELDQVFLEFLEEHNSEVYQKLCHLRIINKSNTQSYTYLDELEYSNLLLDLAPILENFLAQLFFIEPEITKSRFEHIKFNSIYQCKRKFIQRFAIKKYPKASINSIDIVNVTNTLNQLIRAELTPIIFATHVNEWLLDPKKYVDALDIAAQYAAWMVHTNNEHILFQLPKSVNQAELIDQDKIAQYKKHIRIGFDYTNTELTLDNALNNAHYCIYCHKQGKDSCSKGLYNKITEVKTSQDGCPLKQKISEMNYLKAHGLNLAALAVIVIDNPMVAATGHRICNDCSKACIYQKQDAVNIPIIETDILQMVLALPYGLEIYLLLTRWNPLKLDNFLPKAPTGYNVLVVGLGPAGFSLAHYLLNDGHNVTAIDGQKIMPLPFDLQLPIKDWHEYTQNLSERVPQGFGGVVEYGITARWDKNNLIILRLILERRSNFKAYGGVRFGSNITGEQAFAYGFDHIALCVGAGAPKVLKLENGLAKGVKTAADFLMTLQAGGAYHKDSLTNLMIRMPVAVIGCGLTAIDAAVEALNYYPLQVEKFLRKYEQLNKQFSTEIIEQDWTMEDRLIAQEFITHAQLFRAARSQVEVQNILDSLGGVTIYYRGSLNDSAAYKLNHEELMHSMAAGVKFREHMNPVKVNLDRYNYLQSVEFKQQHIRFLVSVKTMLIAIGTGDYIDSDILIKSNKYSYFGDCNPEFAGSVVKALASSKYGYASVTSGLQQASPSFGGDYQKFTSYLDNILLSKVSQVNILTKNIVELIIHAPTAAQNFRPGQFFRLQNYTAKVAQAFEPLALTGAYVDLAQGLISLIILAVGHSSGLCKFIKAGDKVSLMGPTGLATEIIKNSNVVLIGGGLGNAVLFSVGQALRANGCNVIYIAGYKNETDRFYAEKIEEAANTVIWCCENDILTVNRVDDISIKGTVIDGLREYNAKKSDNIVDRIICIGSSSMMLAVRNIKNELFGSSCKLICSINSSMQCMMKGICGQCIQPVLDERNYIFACACQDQDADIVDFEVLRNRLQQNSLLEKIMFFENNL